MMMTALQSLMNILRTCSTMEQSAALTLFVLSRISPMAGFVKAGSRKWVRVRGRRLPEQPETNLSCLSSHGYLYLVNFSISEVSKMKMSGAGTLDVSGLANLGHEQASRLTRSGSKNSAVIHVEKGPQTETKHHDSQATTQLYARVLRREPMMHMRDAAMV
ncbi:hypothetical protein E4U43_006136 [Claviceps pusilla]|uniref:Uncharacterized protein n=1 Tax=Claviceps pusilla TaxID=123648 RepID=A0A9P7N3C4_9HYPO|nr:hypothetical protein E4U43_006136 [Claviceps pusilla]